MSAKLLHTLVVRNPDTLQPVALIAGSDLPDWAEGLVDPGNLEGVESKPKETEGSGASKSYGDLKVAQLKEEIERRNVDREDDEKLSTDGKKADLIAALEADDQARAGA